MKGNPSPLLTPNVDLDMSNTEEATAAAQARITRAADVRVTRSGDRRIIR